MKIKKLIGNFNDPGKTLSQRVVRSGFWVFLLRITERVFSLIRLVILARILSPNDFGLMGIALLTMATLDTFSQTGFQQALIQKKEDIKPYLDSAWTVLILRGFILFAILFFIAPYAATFFNAPQAKPIIQVIGLAVLFQAFTNIGVIYFQKELEFNKQFIYQISGTLADFIVAISAALILKSVWALALGLLAGNFVRLVVSYLIHPYRPHLTFDLGKAKELFGFGKWILGSSILVFLYTQGDDVFVGKLIGTTALGFYQMAYRISLIPVREITLVISQVSFPAFSKLQDQLVKLRVGYLKILKINNFITIPLAAMIFFFSYDFTYLILGKKWLPIVPLLKIFSIMIILAVVNANTGSLYNAVGKPFISVKSQVIRTIVMFSIIYPLVVRLGIMGAASASLISEIMVTPYLTYKVLKIIECKFKDFGQTIFFPLIASIIAVLVQFILKNVLLSSLTLVNLITLTCIGAVVYVTVINFFERISSYSLFQELKEVKVKMME